MLPEPYPAFPTLSVISVYVVPSISKVFDKYFSIKINSN